MHSLWGQTREMLRDDDILRKYSACRPRFLPLHFAFVYSGRKLVGMQSNVTYSGHAEVNCMKRTHALVKRRYTSSRRTRLRMIVVHRNSSGAFTMSRPCQQCCLFLRRHAPHMRVFYTDADGQLQEETSFKNMHKSVSLRHGLCE